MAGRMTRLFRGETTMNFFGRRNIGFAASGLLLVVTVVSLFTQGLNLGIDFKGGVAFEIPVTKGMTIAKADEAMKTVKVEYANAKVQVLSSGSSERIRVQLGDMPAATVTKLQKEFASVSKSTVNDISVSTVSSTWGKSITMKALKALFIFLLAVSAYIWYQFKEWRMALSAIAAVVHDVGISVGVYSVFGLEVTPATVVAFLTILGFSLYDTIVVYDKVRENVHQFSGSRVSYGDIVNVSMNQVLMRSLNTTLAAVLPVLSLLVLGSGVFGAVALREFALALLVGLATGAYSSIYIATPLLGVLKERSEQYRPYRGQLSLREEMTHLMQTGTPVSRRAARSGADVIVPSAPAEAAEVILSHPPRPRKKSRR